MEQESFRRRHLPHWDLPDATYFVTTCLHGSIAAQGLLDIAAYQQELDRTQVPEGMDLHEWRVRKWKLAFVRIEDWLDKKPANSALRDGRLAQEVIKAMNHFAGERYELLAYVVMPSHFHWLFHPLPEWAAHADLGNRTPREVITYSHKRYTSNACNRLMGKKGTFWQAESYDHWVRDVDELERIIHYIEQNPVKAGLVGQPEAWPYSSAAARKAQGLAFGEPIRRSGF